MHFTTYSSLENFSISNPNILLVINFKATWCNPCAILKPYINYLKEHYPNVQFYEIDIEDDSAESFTNKFKIKKLPTFVYFKKGNILHTIVGSNKEQIENAINDYL